MAILEDVTAPGAERRRFQLSNPATREPIGEIDCANPDDVNAAIERARAAQPAWEALGFDGRRRVMDRAVQVVLARADEISETMSRETGRPLFERTLGVVTPVVDSLTYYGKHAERILAEERRTPHLFRPFKKVRNIHRPRGVVAIITPWNFPFVTIMNPAAQALMAGNTVVVKPSEATPFCALLAQEIFREAGVPDDVFQVMIGDGKTGAAVCEGDIDFVSFTGSVGTGKRVGEICGRRLVPCTLELGGKDAAIVCGDANIERASGGVVHGGFFNTGQACASVERVYVNRFIAEAFIERVVGRVQALRQGHDTEYDIGPMIFEPQIKVLEEHIADAVAKGAKLLCGGKRNEALGGLFFEPTVLINVTHDMLCMTEETFGPILAIMEVDSDEEAIQLANDSRFGLSASVYCNHVERGVDLAKRLNCGSAVINDFGGVIYGATETSFGGRGESGVGRVNGDLGLKSYCHTQHLIIHTGRGVHEANWFPYEGKTLEGALKFIRFFYGKGLARRFF